MYRLKNSKSLLYLLLIFKSAVFGMEYTKEGSVEKFVLRPDDYREKGFSNYDIIAYMHSDQNSAKTIRVMANGYSVGNKYPLPSKGCIVFGPYIAVSPGTRVTATFDINVSFHEDPGFNLMNPIVAAQWLIGRGIFGYKGPSAEMTADLLASHPDLKAHLSTCGYLASLLKR